MADAAETTTALTPYQGWETYQDRLIDALTPLTPEQLASRTTPRLRSVGENCQHIIGARARWCRLVLKLDAPALDDLAQWDRAGMPAHSASELVGGLRSSWHVLRDALARWTVADLAYAIPNTDPEPGEPEFFTRQWVVWHLIEHDLHHGGEISQILGAHGLPGLDI